MNHPPANLRPAINTRPAALAACSVLAVVLNGGAIGLASEASSPWGDIAATTRDIDPHRMAVVLVAAHGASNEPIRVSQQVEPVATLAPSPERGHRLPARLPAARTVPGGDDADAPSQAVLFYPFLEVDSPAFPSSDWNLDIDTLDRLGVQRLVFEVLVNDRGDVVGCSVLQPADLSDDVKRDLEKRLSETPLLPALRAGQLVASVRRIELIVASAPPDLPPDPSARHP